MSSGGGANLRSILAGRSTGWSDPGVLSPHQRQVISHVTSCRTAALGGVYLGCDSCEHIQPQYHSCRDRHCPRCQRAQSQAWCERQREAVLPVTYHHLVFTLPSSLNGWIALHPKTLYRILFASSWATLKSFGEDPKRLNGQLGMSSVLHTWGEALTRHVHLHCLVPGGALGAGGQWHPARSNYLFPVRALSRHFRGHVISALRQAANEARLHRVTRSGEIDELLDRLMASDWVVYSKPCPGRAEAVVNYLGRYSHRIAISDERIVSANKAQVSFMCKDYAGDGGRRTLTLGTDEFIRRYLLHVLPKGLMRVRHYGFLSNRCRRQRLPEIRSALEMPTMPEPDAAASTHSGVSDENPTQPCPKCRQGTLRSLCRIEPHVRSRRLTEG